MGLSQLIHQLFELSKFIVLSQAEIFRPISASVQPKMPLQRHYRAGEFSSDVKRCEKGRRHREKKEHKE